MLFGLPHVSHEEYSTFLPTASSFSGFFVLFSFLGVASTQATFYSTVGSTQTPSVVDCGCRGR
jgi:hypothetical protein